MGVHRESFKRYVEVGRVVLLSKGENKNKLAVIEPGTYNTASELAC